jgi:hypothetical protein
MPKCRQRHEEVSNKRGLGFGTIFARTDLSSFEKSNAQEAKVVLGNTNAKIFLKLPSSTERIKA